MTNEKILTMFLKKNRDFASFKRQYIKRHNPVVKVGQVIDRNFNWSMTEERHNYWSDRNMVWKKLCSDLKITGDINLERL